MPVCGSNSLPVAPRETPWDGPGAKARVFAAATTDGVVNVASVARAFFWRDPKKDARTPEAYALQFADFVGGRLQIVPKGLAACAGGRGIGSFAGPSSDADLIRSRITSIYDRVRLTHPDWPASPFAVVVTADANGVAFEGTIALEGVETGDGRFISKGALTWEELPVPLVFDRAEMDHSGATVGTVNEVERRPGGVIWARGNLSDSEDPETQLLVLRTAELFAEGAVGVSVSLDDIEDNIPDDPSKPWPDVVKVTSARLRSVAVVDEAAFIDAKVALVASVRPVQKEWFSNPNFGNGSQSFAEDGGDDRLVWQEPEHPGEVGQYGCPLTITEEGYVYGHAALWNRCHVGNVGTCLRPPREPAAYRGFLTGERIPGIPTGPLVFKTYHAGLDLSASDAQTHYDHTGHAPADVTIGPDAYGIWVSGALRSGTTEEEIEVLRASALSGDWRPTPKGVRLVGILAVSAPGFRVARALAASGALLTVGPGCSSCDEGMTLEDRVAQLEAVVASLAEMGEEFSAGTHTHSVPPRNVTAHLRGVHGESDLPSGVKARQAMHLGLHPGGIENPSKAKASAEVA